MDQFWHLELIYMEKGKKVKIVNKKICQQKSSSVKGGESLCLYMPTKIGL